MLIVTVLPGCQDDVRCRKASLRRSASRSKEVDGHTSHSPGNQTVARQRLAVVCEQVFFSITFLFIWNSLPRERTSQAGQILDIRIVFASKCAAKIVFLLKKNLQLTGFNSFLTF